jgi:Tetracyclin repressor-like, C-terminal domain
VADAEEALVGRVFDALRTGQISRADLTARRLTAFLDQSTIVLYHRFGSLDGFLIRVDGAGWKLLSTELSRVKAPSLEDVALAYVDFAFRHRDLYWLMTEHPFDREALHARGRLRLETPLVGAFRDLLARHGSPQPDKDTLVAFASLHGLASLALSGRLDLGGPRETRQRIRAEARRVAALLTRRPGPHVRSPGKRGGRGRA